MEKLSHITVNKLRERVFEKQKFHFYGLPASDAK